MCRERCTPPVRRHCTDNERHSIAYVCTAGLFDVPRRAQLNQFTRLVCILHDMMLASHMSIQLAAGTIRYRVGPYTSITLMLNVSPCRPTTSLVYLGL